MNGAGNVTGSDMGGTLRGLLPRPKGHYDTPAGADFDALRARRVPYGNALAEMIPTALEVPSDNS